MRPRQLARRLPRPLLYLLVAISVLGVAWALLVPPWQAPDENAHFAYAQGLTEGQGLPGVEPGRVVSGEQERAAEAVNADQLAANLLAKPVWSPGLYEEWRAAPSSPRDDGGGARDGQANTARTNPPLYYAFEAVPYLVAWNGDVFDRLYLMRAWSLGLLLITVSATWLLIGEVLGPRRLLQLAGASLVGLQPEAMFVSATVNPDSLLFAACATVLWLGVRVLRRGISPASAAALCGALAAGILTKATAYAFLPAVALALGVGLARARKGPIRRRTAGAAAATLVVPVGIWLAVARLADRPAVNQVGGGGGYAGPDLPNALGYLWQFYLPKLPFGASLPGSYPRLPAFDFWLRGGWGSFGWLEVTFPDPVYLVLGGLTGLIIAGGVWAGIRAGPRRHVPVVAFLALAAIGLVGGLHATEYRILVDQGIPFMQGRYLLPLLPLLGLCAAAALTLLTRPRQAVAAGALVGGLFALQLFSLGLIVARYYA